METREGEGQQGLRTQIQEAVASGKEKQIIVALKRAALELTGSQKGGDFQGGKERTLKQAVEDLKKNGQTFIVLPGEDSFHQDRIVIDTTNPAGIEVAIGATSSKEVTGRWRKLA